jgi:MFS family permease
VKLVFRSLQVVNYRMWFAGALVSNIGFWMQRTAQDWIVLTELTDHDAAAVGLTMGLQMLPLVLLVPVSGLIADRVNRRNLLFFTNITMALLAIGLGTIVVTGVVQLWHVYAFAFAGGCVAAIENPAKQSFVSELVSEEHLSNAVSLNQASFQTARVIGPSIAAGLVLLVGPGWVFMLNALTFLGILVAIMRLRVHELRVADRLAKGRGAIRAGFQYVWRRPDLIVLMVIVFIIGTFGMNFPIFASTMTTVEFDLGVGQYGILLSALAVGSVAGALLAARRETPRMPVAAIAAGLFGLAMAAASVMPSYWMFAVTLVAAGLALQSVMVTANSLVQLGTEPAMRGRVMALYMTIFVGGTPVGGPLMGWIANTFGPRVAVGVGAGAALVAALIGLAFYLRTNDVRLRWTRSMPLRLAFSRGDRLSAVRGVLAIDEVSARKA